MLIENVGGFLEPNEMMFACAPLCVVLRVFLWTQSFLDVGLFEKSTVRGFRVRIPRHFVINGRYAIFVFVVVFLFS